jgi:hypothetical protein
LFGFGGVNTASLIGQKGTGFAFFPDFENPVIAITGEKFFFKNGRRGTQKISGFANIGTVKMHNTRSNAALETIRLAFKTDRFLFPPFSHLEHLHPLGVEPSLTGKQRVVFSSKSRSAIATDGSHRG